MFLSIVRAAPCVTFDAGVPAGVVGPLRWREAQHATKDDKGDRCLDDDRSDSVGCNVAEAPGGALQGFVSVLKYWEFDEPFALGHDEKLGLETAEDSVDIGVEIRLELVESDLKRKRHSEFLPPAGSLSREQRQVSEWFGGCRQSRKLIGVPVSIHCVAQCDDLLCRRSRSIPVRSELPYGDSG